MRNFFTWLVCTMHPHIHRRDWCWKCQWLAKLWGLDHC